MSFPKPDPSCKEFFETILPPDPMVEKRAMFGNTAGFANGHMFAGTFGSDVVVRLPEAERARLLEEPGASVFSPMPGRVMKEYVMLPRAWRESPDEAQSRVFRALAWVSEMPPKAAKKKAKKKAKKTSAKKTSAKKTSAKKTSAKKKAVKKASGKRTPARKTPANN